MIADDAQKKLTNRRKNWLLVFNMFFTTVFFIIGVGLAAMRDGDYVQNELPIIILPIILGGIVAYVFYHQIVCRLFPWLRDFDENFTPFGYLILYIPALFFGISQYADKTYTGPETCSMHSIIEKRTFHQSPRRGVKAAEIYKYYTIVNEQKFSFERYNKLDEYLSIKIGSQVKICTRKSLTGLDLARVRL